MPYFDYNATAPLSPTARKAWLQTQDELWANPSSPTRAAARARNLLEDCRARLAAAFGCSADRVVFTSGATEGNNAVLQWTARQQDADGAEIAVALSEIEHPSVREPTDFWFRNRKLVRFPVDRLGRVELDSVAETLRVGPPSLVSVLAANNETGVLQPWREILQICRNLAVPFHCDAVQWIGKMPLEGLAEADFVVASGHKFGAPKGVGFLVLGARQTAFAGQMGGGQEDGRRAGTEDVAGIAAMVAALEDRLEILSTSTEGRDRFTRVLKGRGATILGESALRLPNTVAMIMPRFDRMRWISRLDRLGFAVGSGSACATGKEGPSATLSAMQFGPEEASRALRISAGPQTTVEDWNALAQAFAAVEADLDRDQGEERLTTVIDI